MTLSNFKPVWEKLTQLPRRPLLLGGGTVIALAAVLGFANAAENRTTSRLGGIEVTQDETSYVITIPDASESRTRLTGRTLKIRTQDSVSGLQSEQSIALPDADLSREPELVRRSGNLVVTVPKRSPSALTTQIEPFSAPSVPGFGSDIFARMEQMHRQMDSLFSRAFAEMPEFADATTAAPGRFLSGRMNLDLQDRGDTYIIRAQDLDPKKQEINVAVDDERILKITAEEKTSSASSQQIAQFTRSFTLPGRVKGSEMKIDHQGGALVITLPKA